MSKIAVFIPPERWRVNVPMDWRVTMTERTHDDLVHPVSAWLGGRAADPGSSASPRTRGLLGKADCFRFRHFENRALQRQEH